MANGKNGNGWKQVGLAILVPLLLGAVAFGVIREKVNHNEMELDTKADRAVVEVQYDAILRELRSINARLEAIE